MGFLAGVLLVLNSSCLGSRSRLADIRQDFSSLSERMETYQQMQSESRERQQKALQKIQSFIEQESTDLSQRQQDVFPAKPITPSPSPEPLQSVPIEEHPVSPPPTAVSSNQQDAEQLFRSSMEKYILQQYTAAAEGFLLAYTYTRQPELQARCLYWAGECHYHNREWAKALQCFVKVEHDYPEQAVAPSALLKEGYSLINSGKFSEGKKTLQRLIDAYPQSNEASSARERLRELGGS